MTNEDSIINDQVVGASRLSASALAIGHWSLVIHWSFFLLVCPGTHLCRRFLALWHWSFVISSGHWTLVIGHSFCPRVPIADDFPPLPLPRPGLLCLNRAGLASLARLVAARRPGG